MNDKAADISGAFPGQIPAGANKKNKTRQSHEWIWVCLILLAVTWLPVFGLHFNRMSLSESSTGTVVVAFPPMVNTREVFGNVMEANGSIVEPVRWFPGMWLARSLEPGFVGRLKARGAWGVYSPDVLKASALLTCIQVVAPPSSSNPANQDSPPPASK